MLINRKNIIKNGEDIMGAIVTKFANGAPAAADWISDNVTVGFFSNNTRIQSGLVLVYSPDNDVITTVQGTFDDTTPWANVYTGDGDTLGASIYQWPGGPVESNPAAGTYVRSYLVELPGVPPRLRVQVSGGAGALSANVWLCMSDG